MKAEDFGISPLTGRHDKRLTPAESCFLSILWTDHVGAKNKISADDLAVMFAWKFARRSLPREVPWLMNRWKRWVRQMQNHLLRDHQNIPVLSKAGFEGGYWIAENRGEAKEFYDTFRRRGMTGLVKATRGQQSATVDLVQQIAFEFDDLVDHLGPGPRVKSRAAVPMPVEVVDAFLARMTRNPEEFADGLRKIGEKYGSVLLPKERLRMIESRVAELQDLVGNLQIK